MKEQADYVNPWNEELELTGDILEEIYRDAPEDFWPSDDEEPEFWAQYMDDIW